MPSRPQPPPALKYEPLPRSASRRWMGAVAALVVVLVVLFVAGRAFSNKVRDLTPHELREKMAQTSAELPLEQAIEQVNRMDADSRREVMQSPEAREYVQRLPPEKRLTFVEKTLDRGIRQQIERYRKLNTEERKAFIEEAKQRQKENRERMDSLPPEEKQRLRQMASGSDMQEMVEKAVKAFLSLTTSDERAELAPLYEGALDNLSHARGVK